MRRSLALVLHAGAVGIMAFGWFALGEVGSWMKTQKGGYFQFLTNQGLVVSLLCMFVSLFCDLFPSIKVIRQIKRSILMISLPLEFGRHDHLLVSPLILPTPHRASSGRVRTDPGCPTETYAYPAQDRSSLACRAAVQPLD